jgi:type I restriction enzyme S subunit
MTSVKGTKMPRGDKNAIMKYLVKVPKIEEQKAIANILQLLMRRLKLTTKSIKTLRKQHRQFSNTGL